VLATAALSDEELGEFLRREDVHEPDLAAWRETLQEAALAGFGESAEDKRDAKRIRETRGRAASQGQGLGRYGRAADPQKKVLRSGGTGTTTPSTPTTCRSNGRCE
jgi:transposase